MSKLSYSDRANLHTNETAKRLLHLMDRKKTNLAFSVDSVSKKELLHLTDLVGPYICVLKTHIDIVEDFDADLISQLVALAKKHDFLIFEDRKFADIGNTVKMQYKSGVYKISSWSDITNAHPIPGDGIVKGLSEVGLPLGRALLLLAEMSSDGSLARGEYSVETFRMAQRFKNFCIGFIGQRRLENELEGCSLGQGEDFIYMTPGVNMEIAGDSLGQSYRTPEEVIVQSGCDVIIVGRGIYGKRGNDAEVVSAAEKFRTAGWDAYLKRLKQTRLS
ncbi:orotidine 5'-phosphate decarboxylase [Phlyctochytrium bullatum]|nr:orotidine 5'-phosphate decarboxylase [Phlyctochytrium bullatum]